MGSLRRFAGDGRGRMVVGVGVAALSAAACSAGPTETEMFEPAARYTVTGEASGTNGDVTVSCTMDLAFEWDGMVRLETGQVYVTTGGGDVERTIERPDGTGLVFSPFLFSEDNHVRLVGADSIALQTPENFDTGVPFYDGIGDMRGRITGPGSAEGTWTCGQLEIDEDRAGSVQGTWRMAPA